MTPDQVQAVVENFSILYQSGHTVTLEHTLEGDGKTITAKIWHYPSCKRCQTERAQKYPAMVKA